MEVEKMNAQIKLILILAALFILALGLRINLISQPGYFEYDNFFEMRMVKDVTLTGHVQNPDDLAYYQISPLPPQQENLLWNMCAGIYQVTIGWWAGFNEELFTKEMSILPAIFGALTCLVLFFIGKTASNGNNTIGYITMFVAAVTPGFLYRQMVGSQFTNSSGFLAISLGILFLMWAFNVNKLSNKDIKSAIKPIGFSVISGVCFLFSVLTWSFYLIIPLLLIAFWAYRVVISLTEIKNMDKIKADIGYFISIFSLFMLGCVIKNFDWVAAVAFFLGIPAIIMYIIVVLVIFIGSIVMCFTPQLNDEWRRGIKSVVAIGFILLALGAFYFTTLGIDVQDRTSTGGMVGEQAVGNQFFIQKYNIFNLLIPLGMIGMAALFIWKGNKYEYAPMLFAGFLITFIMAWLTLKFCYNLGYGLSFAVIIISILGHELWDILKEKNKTELKIIFLPAVIFLIMGISAASVFIGDYNSALTSNSGLQDVINYFNEQTPEESKILNNWGMGHILSYGTSRPVSSDNRNYSVLANAQFAIFENDSNVQKVYDMVREMGADYIIVQVNDFYSMQSNEFYINNKVDWALGAKFREPIINSAGCNSDGNIAVCPGVGQLEVSKFSKWTSIPVSFYGGQYPIYLYIIGQNAVILNPAANETNLAKILTNHPDAVGKYEKVFESGSYIILKVIK